MIPFANPRAAYLQRKTVIEEAILKVLDQGNYILGPEVGQFEAEFSKWNDGRDGDFVSVANGTDAIELVLRALDVNQNTSVVFTVSHTAVATVAAIQRSGCIAALVDIDEKTFTMDPESLEIAILNVLNNYPNLKPSAVIPVHLYGSPCKMDEIIDIASRYGLSVIEDCAQAHGAQYEGRKVGNLGIAGTFSFYPTKNLGALGDAGGIFSSNRELSLKCKILRQYGWRDRYISSLCGINSRLDTLQAAILRVQLAYLDEDNERRRAIAAIYSQELSGTGALLPHDGGKLRHVYHLYVIKVRERERFIQYMKEQNVACAVHYPVPVHLQPAYTEGLLMPPSGLQNTETVCKTIVSLPMFPQLKDDEVEHVCAAVQSFGYLGFENGF